MFLRVLHFFPSMIVYSRETDEYRIVDFQTRDYIIMLFCPNCGQKPISQAWESSGKDDNHEVTEEEVVCALLR